MVYVAEPIGRKKRDKKKERGWRDFTQLTVHAAPKLKENTYLFFIRIHFIVLIGRTDLQVY